MKIKQGLMLCKVGEEYVVLADGNVNMQISGLTTVNETGAFIWETLQQEHTQDEVVDAMTQEFDIDRDTASQDITQFCALLKRAGFLA